MGQFFSQAKIGGENLAAQWARPPIALTAGFELRGVLTFTIVFHGQKRVDKHIPNFNTCTYVFPIRLQTQDCLLHYC